MRKDTYMDVTAMTDEEVEELYAFRKTNTLKSAAPLYVYLVVQEHSGPRRHLSQREILDYVEDEFGVRMERKALSRWLHLLMALDIGIFSVPGLGTWACRENTAA